MINSIDEIQFETIAMDSTLQNPKLFISNLALELEKLPNITFLPLVQRKVVFVPLTPKKFNTFSTKLHTLVPLLRKRIFLSVDVGVN